MAMGKRKRDRQPAMWMATTDFPTAASHPFYTRLNQLLREHGFDDFAEAQCATFYAETMGRPGLPPGIYLRLLLIGYFEGIDSERGIAWRAADSFALRDFLGVGLEDAPPDHSTISRTRRLIDLETHRAVFTWVLQCLSMAGLVKGKTIGIDATTLEANAALRSIVRRDSGESYEEFLTTLAKASGIGTPNYDSTFTRVGTVRLTPVDVEFGGPVAAPTVDQPVLSPPDNRMVAVSVDPHVTDEYDPEPICRISKVVNSEGPASGPDPDIEITYPLSVNLRATRLGSGTGRTYTLTLSCTDALNGTSTADVSVVVPHDSGN
jgi:transposase